jgi:hypothetical protein
VVTLATPTFGKSSAVAVGWEGRGGVGGAPEESEATVGSTRKDTFKFEIFVFTAKDVSCGVRSNSQTSSVRADQEMDVLPMVKSPASNWT